MAQISGDVRSLARAHTPEAIRKLATLMRHAESESVQMGCAALLIERGWGKAPQSITGADGEGPIQVVIRNFLRGEDARIVEHQPVPIGTSEG